MEDYYEVQIVETVAVSQRRRGCCIHQTVMTTLLAQTDQKLAGDLVAAARRQINDSDYDSVAEQVAAIGAVVAQVKQIGAAMSRVKDRVEKLEKELAEVKRELERCRPQQEQDRWPWGKTLARTVAGAVLPDGLRSKLRVVRNLLDLVLDD